MLKTIEIKNRKAKHDYHFLQSFEAGIMLAGTEVKSIKAGHANLSDAYCLFNGGEIWVHSLYIKEYQQGAYNNHDTRKDRKLLLNKSELKKLAKKAEDKGITIIPYRMFVNDRGFIKLEIYLAEGKKSYDKRETIKERDTTRELERTYRVR